MPNYALDYSALDTGWATQGAADYCRDNGHATHVKDGVDTGVCPRCLTVTEARYVLIVTVKGDPAYLTGRLDPTTWRMRYGATLDIDKADYFATRANAERAMRRASKHFDAVEIGTLD